MRPHLRRFQILFSPKYFHFLSRCPTLSMPCVHVNTRDSIASAKPNRSTQLLDAYLVMEFNRSCIQQFITVVLTSVKICISAGDDKKSAISSLAP